MSWRWWIPLAALCLLACQPQVNVVPAGPIVIQLDIRHEVRLRLDDEVSALLDDEKSAVVPRGVSEERAVVIEAIGAYKAGEQADGYVGVVPGLSDAHLDEAVRRFNEWRRERYARVASETDTQTSIVAAVAGTHRISATPRGAPVRAASGIWTTRP